MVKNIVKNSFELLSITNLKEKFEIGDIVLLPNGEKAKVIGTFDFNRGRFVKLDNGLIKKYQQEQLKIALSQLNPSMYKDKSILFSTNRNNPIVYVIKQDEKFKVHYFYTVNEILDLFIKHPSYFKQEFKTLFSTWDEDRTIPIEIFKKSLKLSLDFLNRYKSESLIELLTKKISYVSKEDLFDVLVGEFKYSPSMFEKLYGEISDKQTGRLQQEKYKNWVLIYDTQAKTPLVNIKLLLDDVEAKLGSLNKLAYGKIFVVDSLAGTALADYNISSDVIRVSLKKVRKVEHNELDSFMHELGHRNWYKNLSDTQKKQVTATFHQQKTNTSSVNAGDVLIDKTNGNKYKVIKPIYKRKLFYISELIEFGKPNKKYTIGTDYQIPSELIGTIFSSDNNNNSFFNTQYSLVSVEEFYAELFSAWGNKKLKEPAKSWMENLHKGV